MALSGVGTKFVNDGIFLLLSTSYFDLRLTIQTNVAKPTQALFSLINPGVEGLPFILCVQSILTNIASSLPTQILYLT